uniref:Uncharacterized protein LOC105046495 n=1 Tax=Elaeis guineensis var. tenera TaxID=51953 RepID=A0A8N4IGK2_ELAGV|nr:uncharacterized protein LOC105046495 [Elaeis guineensis]
METKSIPQLWHQNGMCPEDTIPIRRTKKEDVLRATSVERYGKKRHRPIPNPTSVHPTWSNTGHEYAIGYVNATTYNGVQATINVWSPKVQEQSEFSGSQIWIIGGPIQLIDTIEAGWHVMPSLYGDDKTRLFASWTGTIKMYVSMSYGLVVLLPMIISLWCIEAMTQAMMQQWELQQLLKQLNKPAVKSIKSPDGDIIDCVHISHQPAFDHPLLKNHTVQMRPSFFPSGLYDENDESSSIPQLWHQNGRCPEDTIPIRRTKKDDVLRASPIERYGKKSPGTIPNPNPSYSKVSGDAHEHAVVYARGGKYYGAKAQINVWNPMVQERKEFSLSQLWVSAGPVEQLNTVEAGWHVCPSLYGDDKTRLFAYWTSDSYRSTGCYNLGCSGFIQVNRDIALGAVIYPISSYGGREYEITLLIWKDPISGNWWLQYGNLSPIGYWPSSLFRDLSDSASLIEWGGEVVNLKLNGGHTSTKMGSGHFPGEGFGKASYFKNIQIVDQSNHLQAFQGIDNIITRPTCYDLRHADEGYIYYGGPGRNPNCP